MNISCHRVLALGLVLPCVGCLDLFDELTEGAVPEELVGIWQQTRASAGDYENGYGESFSITSGFSVELRLRADGSYTMAHFASGASSSCGAVSYLDESAGTAVVDEDTLTLQPSERTLDIDDCDPPRTETLATDPIEYAITLTEGEHMYGGLRTWLMGMEGGPHPFELTLLNLPPETYEPVQPAQPADFVLGVDAPYVEFQGLWAAANGTDSSFYDPDSGDHYFPELNGSPHEWIRFSDDTYEAAVALQGINPEGVCEADVIYYERGKALFEVLEVLSGGTHLVGHTRLAAEDASLIVRVRECDDDDATYEYSVAPLLSYYRFIYFSAESSTESFQLVCDFEQSEWQSMLCNSSSFYPR